MKYDISKKQSIGVKRTLTQLRSSLLTLLMKKSFDDISVGELCELSMISKATFYNYFDDKYDLLRYFFQYCKNEITQSTDNSYDNEAFPRLLDAIDQQRVIIRKVLRHNPTDGALQRELLTFMNQVFERIAKKTSTDTSNDIPLEIRTKVNTYAFLTVLDWAYIQEHTISQEEVQRLLGRLHH